MTKKFRNLHADEIECRVQQVDKQKGAWCSVLLYKNARCDMNMLDEVYGSNNWQRTHEVINGQLFCNVDIWDEEKHMWIRKQDVGTESNTEAEKGRASDSFKRACVNIGIGRELYTAPHIFISLGQGEAQNGRMRTTFAVREIGYDDKNNINKLVIIDNRGAVRYELGAKIKQNPQPVNEETLNLALQELNAAQSKESLEEIMVRYKMLWQNTKFLNTVKKMREKYPKQ